MFTANQEYQMLLHFSLRIHVFEVHAYFESSVANDPKMTLSTKRSKVPVYHLGSLIWGPIFKIAIFVHGTWLLAKDLEVAQVIYFLFTPKGSKCSLCALYMQWFPRYVWINFQNCHIWAWSLATGQSSRSSTYALFLPQRAPNSTYFRCMGSGFRNKYEVIFKIPIFGYEAWSVADGPDFAHLSSFYPQTVAIELFLAMGSYEHVT